MTNLHLALLVCDTPRPQVLEKYGDYPQMFSKVFTNALGDAGSVTWEFFDVVNKQEYPSDTSKFDGLVLTGSSASAYEDVPWIIKLVDFVKQQLNATIKKKLVGICFGHQIIARAAGGICAKNPKGWEFGYYEISLTPFGQRYFQTDKTILRLNQVHQDHVTELPPGFQSLATTAPHTPIHAMVSDDGQCITIQGHPEFNRDTVRILINLRADAGVISRELADRELEKLEQAGPDMEDTWLVRHFLDFIQGKHDKKPTTPNDQDFLSFEQYDFDSDDRFKAGVSSIMNRQEGNKDEMLEKAKWFYYTKFVKSFNFDDYQQWKTNKTQASEGSQLGTTATSGPETPKETNTSTTANGEQITVPPKLTFQQIVEMIETGQEIPGIRQIPDKLNDGQPSQPQLKARPKPWERGQQ